MSTTTATATPSPAASITKELLEGVTNCKVVSYGVEDGSRPGDNYLSVLYSVSAQVIPKEESNCGIQTRHYLIKCYPSHPSRQAYLNKTNFFHKELSFYQIWTKELVNFQTRVAGISSDGVITPGFPPCVGGNAVNFWNVEPEAHYAKVYDPLDNFIMMTDLRKTWGYKMADNRKGLDVDHVRLAFTELATIHALSWAYKNRVEMDVTKKYPFLRVPFTQDDVNMWSKVFDGNVNSTVATLDAVLGKDNHLSRATQSFHPNSMKVLEFFINQDPETERNLWDLHRSPPANIVEAVGTEEPWRVICHADTWCNNMLFKYDKLTGKPSRIMLVDFQWTRPGCPCADLVIAVYTSTTADFRKQHLDHVLELYCARFVEACEILGVAPLPGFNFRSLKARFHRLKVVAYMQVIFALALMLAKNDNGVNLEEQSGDDGFEDMYIDAFGKGSGDPVYSKRLLDIAQELYDDGVI